MNLFKKNANGIFASESVFGHLIRGAIGIALVVWAVRNQGTQPGLAIAAGLCALVAFRGCPMCWTVGLIETITYKMKAMHRGNVGK